MNATNGSNANGTRNRPRRGQRKGAAGGSPKSGSLKSGSAKSSADFWGSADKLPSVEEVTVSTDASAVVRSLGRPPFPGHEAVSEYYLRAVYDNTVKLAEVLATAGDLLSESAEPAESESRAER